VAQRLLPSAIATASAIFITAPALSSALGGLAGGIGAGTIGLPLVFVVPAALALVASAGLLVLHRRIVAETGRRL
jgi:SET family sugar efflux transporter-like MFS transporter